MSYIPSFYTTTTYTDLTNSNNSIQTTDGNYSLTNRPNTGDDILIVTVVDNGDFIEFMHNGTNAYQVNLCQF